MTYCICLDVRTNELSIMTSVERDMMISALQSVNHPVPTIVIKRKDSKEDAELYLQEIKNANNIIDNL